MHDIIINSPSYPLPGYIKYVGGGRVLLEYVLSTHLSRVWSAKVNEAGDIDTDILRQEEVK